MPHSAEDAPHRASFATGEGIIETVVEAAGVATRVRYSAGTGPTLVLLPGGMLDTSLMTWKKALEALPARFRVFVPDLPGYGESGFPPAGSFTTEWYAEWLAALVQALGLDRFALGGSSMSGAVALVYTLKHPARVEKLLLSGAFGVQDRVHLHEAAALLARAPGLAALSRKLLRHPTVLRLALHLAVWHSSAITGELVRDCLAGLARPRALDAFTCWLRTELLPHHVCTNVTPLLGSLDVPVLWLHGARDRMLSVAHVRRAAALTPRAELHVFEKSGHLVPREFPAAVNARIVQFLTA